MKMRKHQNSGFTLLEILIGVGITTTLALGTMNLMEMSIKSQVQNELILEKKDISISIKSQGVCNETLSNQALPYSGSIFSDRNTNKTILKVSPYATDITNATNSSLSPDQRETHFQTLRNNILSDPAHKKKIAIQSIIFSDNGDIASQANQTGSGVQEILKLIRVQIVYGTFNIKKPIGQKVILTTQTLYTTVRWNRNTSRIINCQSGSDQSGSTISQIALCQSVGGNFNQTTGRCENTLNEIQKETVRSICQPSFGVYNSTTGSCIPHVTKHFGLSCPDGFKVVAIENTRLVCDNINNPDPNTRAYVNF